MSYEPHHTHLFLQNSSLQSCSATVSWGKGRKHRYRRAVEKQQHEPHSCPAPCVGAGGRMCLWPVHLSAVHNTYFDHGPQELWMDFKVRLNHENDMTWSAEDNSSLISTLSGLNPPLGQMVTTFETVLRLALWLACFWGVFFVCMYVLFKSCSFSKINILKDRGNPVKYQLLFKCQMLWAFHLLITS